MNRRPRRGVRNIQKNFQVVYGQPPKPRWLRTTSGQHLNKGTKLDLDRRSLSSCDASTKKADAYVDNL